MNHHCIWDASIGKWDDTEKIHTLNNIYIYIYIYSFFENQLHSFLGSIQHIKILKKKKKRKG